MTPTAPASSTSITVRRVTLVVLILLAIIFLAYLAHREQQQASAESIIGKYTQFKPEDGKVVLPLTLDCPPFGQQTVKFRTDELKKANLGEDPAVINTVAITRRWPELWGGAYAEIDNEITNQNASRDDLTGTSVVVDLPDGLLEDSGNWSITLNVPKGTITAQMVGAKAASVTSNLRK